MNGPRWDGRGGLGRVCQVIIINQAVLPLSCSTSSPWQSKEEYRTTVRARPIHGFTTKNTLAAMKQKWESGEGGGL